MLHFALSDQIDRFKVSDIYCTSCGCYLGWRYEEASEQSQKYKENKVVLEKARMIREEWTT